MRFLLMLVLLAVSQAATAGSPPLIAVASNFRQVMEALNQRFEQQTGLKLRISYASSGLLSQQLQQGAPFELFISADPRYINTLPASKVKRQAVLAYGQLAILLSNSAPLHGDASLTQIVAALQHGDMQRFAIANPAHAPFGQAARQVLKHLHHWQAIQPFLVTAENAAQSVQFIIAGVAQAGLVPYSLALAPGVKSKTRAHLLAANLQPDLPQTAALLAHAGRVSQRFYQFLQQADSQALLRQQGYRIPQVTP